MSLGASIISFSPGTVIRSSDVNSNFAALNAVTSSNNGWTVSGNPLVVSGQSIQLDNNWSVSGKDTGGTYHVMLFCNTFNETTIQQAANSSRISFWDNAGGVVAQFAPADGYNAGQLYDKYGNRICATSAFSGTGTGTYNHNYQHYTPNICTVTSTATNNETSVGVDSLGSSTVHVNMFNSLSFVAVAYHT